MALAPLLYNITFDSQTRILYFWDKAGHEIYHCEIPSPAPSLPTIITKNGTVGTESAQGTIATLANNASCYLWVYDSSSSSYELFAYDNISHIPCCARISDSSGLNTTRYGFEAEFTQNGNIKITNKTGSAYNNALGALCKICSSNLATVITVYDSSNNPYNAFQYTSDGTDYYYVLDGTQTDWTDDLSGIGYSLQQIYTAYFSDQGESGSNVTYSGTSRLYDASGNLLYYDSTKSYTLITGYLKNGTENNPNEWGVQCYFTQQDTSLHTLGLFLNEAFTFYKILYLMERLPAPDLPTVNTAGFIMPGHAVTINAGTTSTGWYVGSTGQPFVYESTKSYGVGRAMDDIGGNDIDPTVFALVDSSGELAVKNISNSPVNVGVIYVSICSSPNTTVVTVYDSSNNPYNAFKYSLDGTDYYYVLDGTQTDWTDDLSGIGYSLQQIYTGWCKSDHSNMNFSLWNECNLLDNSGNQITRASGMGNPTIYKLYNSNGDEVSASFTIQWNDPYYTGTYKLMIKCYDGNSPSIAKVDYKLG